MRYYRDGQYDALTKFGLDLSWAQPAIEWTVNNVHHFPDMARQVIQDHPLTAMAGTGAATGAAGWTGGRLFQATKDTGKNLARGLARGGQAVGQGIHGAGQALAGAFRKRALDEHNTYAGPPSFRPVDTAEVVSSEAGKQLDDRREDGRNDLRGAPAGFAILGNKVAAMTPGFIRSIARDADVEVGAPEFKEKVRGLTGKVRLEEMSSSELQQVAKMLWQKNAQIKEADALSRAVQRGVVTPSIENARRLRAQMPGSRWSGVRAPSEDTIQRTLSRMQEPQLNAQGVSALQRMRGKLRESDFTPARAAQLEKIQAGSVAPRMRELGQVSFGPESLTEMNMGGRIRRVTPEMKRLSLVARKMGLTQQLPATLKQEHLKPAGHEIKLEQGPGYLQRPALEHEAGERWLLEQAARGKPVTPYASHMGPEATAREWYAAAHNPRGWHAAHELRAGQPGISDSAFPRFYTEAGGTQGAPIAPGSRRERALGRMYDRLLAQAPHITEQLLAEGQLPPTNYRKHRLHTEAASAPMLNTARGAALAGARLTPGAEAALAHPLTQHAVTGFLPGDLPEVASLPRQHWAKLRRRLTT